MTFLTLSYWLPNQCHCMYKKSTPLFNALMIVQFIWSYKYHNWHHTNDCLPHVVHSYSKALCLTVQGLFEPNNPPQEPRFSFCAYILTMPHKQAINFVALCKSSHVLHHSFLSFSFVSNTKRMSSCKLVGSKPISPWAHNPIQYFL